MSNIEKNKADVLKKEILIHNYLLSQGHLQKTY